MKGRRRLEVRISPLPDNLWRVEGGCHVMELTSAATLRLLAEYIADPYATWERYRVQVIAERERKERAMIQRGLR